MFVTLNQYNLLTNSTGCTSPGECEFILREEEILAEANSKVAGLNKNRILLMQG